MPQATAALKHATQNQRGTHFEEGLKNDLRKIKARLTCSICQETMFQPFLTVECSHSFCYTCLYNWLKHHKTCPACRTKITSRPVLNLGLRDISELMLPNIQHDNPGDAEFLQNQQIEAQIRYEADKTGNRIFAGLFSETSQGTKSRLVDFDDGVVRCARCNWEVESGSACLQCGFTFSDASEDEDYDYDVEDESLDLHESDMELDGNGIHPGMRDFIEEDDYEPGYPDFEGFSDGAQDDAEGGFVDRNPRSYPMDSDEFDDDDRNATDLSFVDQRDTSDIIGEAVDPAEEVDSSETEAQFSSPARPRRLHRPPLITDQRPTHHAGQPQVVILDSESEARAPTVHQSPRRRTQVVLSSDEE